MRLSNETQMFPAEWCPPVRVIVDDRVISQNEVAHSLTVQRQPGRLAAVVAYGSTAWPEPSAARAA